MESDVNQLSAGVLVCNAINTYHGWHKQRFYVEPLKTKIVTVSIKTFAITNVDVKVWTRKSEFPQGNLLCVLTQPEIIRQRIFNVIDI